MYRSDFMTLVHYCKLPFNLKYFIYGQIRCCICSGFIIIRLCPVCFINHSIILII